MGEDNNPIIKGAGREYVEAGPVRLIFENGEYVGWYCLGVWGVWPRCRKNGMDDEKIRRD